MKIFSLKNSLPAFGYHLLTLLIICGFVAIISIGLSAATALLDQTKLEEKISESFNSGELSTESYLGNDKRRGRYGFNDCLLLQTLTLTRGDWRNAGLLSPIMEASEAPPCQVLRDYVNKSRSDNIKTYNYSRYFFAAKAIVGPALIYWKIDDIRIVLRKTVYYMLILVLLVSCARLIKPGPMGRLLPVTLLIAGAGWLMLYDLRYYSPLMTHGFSEIILVGYMVYSLVAPPPSGTSIPRRVVFLGALTACFELLTGPALLAAQLAVIIDFAQRGNAKNPGKRAIQIFGSVALSIIITLLVLQLAVSLLIGREAFLQFFQHLLLRMGLHHVFQVPVEEAWKIPGNLKNYSTIEALTALFGSLPMLTHSSQIGANIIFSTSFLALIWATFMGVRYPHLRSVLIYVGVVFSLIVWCAIFSNHTANHAWAMVRMAVIIPICAMLSIFYLYKNVKNISSTP